MPFLRNPFQFLSTLWPSSQRAQQVSSEKIQDQEQENLGKIKRSASKAFRSSELLGTLNQNKRRKTEDSRDDVSDVLFNKEIMVSVQNGADMSAKRNVDRTLMPPPRATTHAHNRRQSSQSAAKLPFDLAETASEATRSTRVAKSDLLDEYDMEEARRKAAATQLPPNSGIWDTGERELFFHLSYRGFEPLLPRNWMIDFPTLPLSVFAHQDTDIPLIQCHRSTQFRAIRALRELLDTGTTIRDRKLSDRDLRTEPVLEKATTKFITWALKDKGYPEKPSKTTIPVHSIATLQPGQSTQEVIRKLASEMHILAAKHREAVNVRSSVEQQEPDALTPPHSDSVPTQIHPDVTEEEKPLPVIYGIMIASSLIAVFTLNSHIPFPPFLVRALLRNQQSTLTPEKAAAINPHLPAQIKDLMSADSEARNAPEDEDSGIRYIANFDFSETTADVWNALAIAIVAMQIRKTMGEVFKTWQQIDLDHDIPEKASLTDNRDNVVEDDSNGILMCHLRKNINASSMGIDIEDSWLSNVETQDNISGSIRPLSESDGPVLSSPLSRKARGKRSRKTVQDPDA